MSFRLQITARRVPRALATLTAAVILLFLCAGAATGQAARRPAPAARVHRLMAIARLDAAVRYFHPSVATRASSWDANVAANLFPIANAASRSEYATRIAALLATLEDNRPSPAPRQRALRYNGFPPMGGPPGSPYRLEWRPTVSAETYRVDMGEGAVADVVLSDPDGDTTSAVTVAPTPTDASWMAGYPSAAYRILAACRLWSTIDLFYPYKALIRERWDDQFRAALPTVEAARDSLEFIKAMAAFATHIHDSHVTAATLPIRWLAGRIPAGVETRLIDDQLVITHVVDTAARSRGVREGDVVVSVDGEAVRKRIRRLSAYYPVSTEQSLRNVMERWILYGRDTMPAQLEVRHASGALSATSVRRSSRYTAQLWHRTGEIIRMLPGNIGYVDLDRLPPALVDSAFRVLAHASAIIFDDRGYPQGTVWTIAPRLNQHPDSTPAAEFRRRIVSSPDTTRTTITSFLQRIDVDDRLPKYSGRTVLLIDQSTMSHGEHTGLYFEAANGTPLIGSPTAGANGDITMLLLPGNLAVTFTGQEVRHADGRQLQRVGLQPEVLVQPTLAGIRAGSDEVLEAAFRFLGGKGPIPPP